MLQLTATSTVWVAATANSQPCVIGAVGAGLLLQVQFLSLWGVDATQCVLIRITYHLEISTCSASFPNNLRCAMASNMIPFHSSLDLEQIAQGLDRGDFTVKELTEAHLACIEKLNPSLHAVLQLNPAALSIAAALDDELKRSGRRG